MITTKNKSPQKNKYSIKEFINNFVHIAKLFVRYKAQVILAIVFALSCTVLSMITPKVMASIINELFYGLGDKTTGEGGINYTILTPLLILVSSLFLINAVCGTLQGIFSTNVSRRVCYDLRKEISIKINTLPISYFESTSKGNLLSRVINDVDMLGQNIAQVFISFITTTTMLVGSVIMMFSVNVTLALIALILIPISMGFISLIIRYSQRIFVRSRRALGEVNGFVEEYVNGHQLVQVYNKQDETVDKFNEINNRLYKNNLVSSVISSISSPLMSIVNNLANIVSTILGAYFSIIGVMTVGDIQAFLSYLGGFTSPLNSIVSLFNQIQSMAASSERIYEFLEIPDEIDTSKALPETATADKETVVSFENIDFSYTGDVNVINDFSLDIKKGQTVAIVGPTGAGKTTIVKLLMRYYDVSKGSIKLHGVDIKDMKCDDVREHFAMVLQDIWLFSGNIEDNIRYGRLDASTDEVKNAGKLACADDFINLMPQQYKSNITEGAKNLSQGQKQLISIARAIIADREVMILDEATSSVDTATEQQLYEAFDKLIEQKTSIVIAHRLSTIKNADVILVLNNGDVIEQGNHETLLAKKGFYYDLYQSGLK